MATFVFVDKNQLRPASDTKVIKAADAAVVLDAQEILDEARNRAAQIIKSAEDVFQAEKQRGFTQGVQEANQKMVQEMAKTALRTEQHYQSLTSQTIELVMAVVKKVLGDMDVRSMVVAQAIEALKSAKAGKRLILKVNPEAEETLNEHLSRINTGSAQGGIIEVECSANLAPGDLIIESEIGIVEASMAVQLDAIEKAFRATANEGGADGR